MERDIVYTGRPTLTRALAGAESSSTACSHLRAAWGASTQVRLRGNLACGAKDIPAHKDATGDIGVASLFLFIM